MVPHDNLRLLDQLVWAFEGENLTLNTDIFFSILAHENIHLHRQELAELVERAELHAEVKRRQWRLRLNLDESKTHLHYLENVAAKAGRE